MAWLGELYRDGSGEFSAGHTADETLRNDYPVSAFSLGLVESGIGKIQDCF